MEEKKRTFTSDDIIRTIYFLIENCALNNRYFLQRQEYFRDVTGAIRVLYVAGIFTEEQRDKLREYLAKTATFENSTF